MNAYVYTVKKNLRGNDSVFPVRAHASRDKEGDLILEDGRVIKDVDVDKPGSGVYSTWGKAQYKLKG